MSEVHGDPRMFAEYVPHPLTREPAIVATIRTAVRADAPELARLAHQRQGGPLAKQLESFERGLALGPGEHLILLAEAHGLVLGYGRASWFTRPPDAPPSCGPSGWYLGGLVVDPAVRRRGIGRRLTAARLSWLAERADEAFYSVSALNRPSIDLHAPFGFVEAARDLSMPGVSFSGGVGILFRVDFSGRRRG